MTEVTDEPRSSIEAAEFVFPVSNFGDYIVALVLHPFF
jgi:hypothetical protein